MTTTSFAIGTKIRSFDFHPGDEYYIDGEIVGYARCVIVVDEDGNPSEGFEPVESIDETNCVHYVVATENLSPAWIERGRFDMADLIYPARTSFWDDPMVIEQPPLSAAEVVRSADAVVNAIGR